MHPLTELAYMHLYRELYNSSLLLAEHAINNHIDLEDAFFIAVRSLSALKYFGKLEEMTETFPEILKNPEILLILLQQGTGSENCALEDTSVRTTVTHPRVSRSFTFSSLTFLFKGLAKRERVRKKYLIASFQADHLLIESLRYLMEESLCTDGEVMDLIEQAVNSQENLLFFCSQEYKSLLQKVFFEVPKDFIFSPWKHRLLCKTYASTSNFTELFRLGISGLDSFNGSPLVQLSLGLYYILQNKYKEARGPVSKALKEDSRLGYAYMYAGIIHAHLLEAEKAVAMLSAAFAIMDTSVIPGYFLAYEYHAMNNYSRSKHIYEITLRRVYFESPSTAMCIALGPDKEDISPERIAKRNKCLRQESEHDLGSLKKTICRSLGWYKLKNSLREGPSLGRLTLKDESRILFVFYSYIYSLLYNEEYECAISLIKEYAIKNLLKVYAFLFVGEVDEARSALQEVPANEKESRIYYATSGYLHHLMAKYQEARCDYEKSLRCGTLPVVEELLSLVILNSNGSETNRAFDYVNSLFDAMEYSKRNVDVINLWE